MKKKTLLGILIMLGGLFGLCSNAFATVYNVGTLSELNALSRTKTYSGDTINLTADISIAPISTYTPVGTESYPFAGTFEGNNHTIKFLSGSTSRAYFGVLGKTSSSAIVRNLTVEGTIQYASGASAQYTGGIVGYNLGEINNCTNKSNITAGMYTGGITGYSMGSIISCNNTGEIKGGNYVGGISGIVSGNSNVVVEYCYNTGNVNQSSKCLGGIAGNASSGVTLSHCGNEGTISGFYPTSTSSGTVTISDASETGGIVGHLAVGYVTQCYNTGIVTTGGYVGGIVGHSSSGSVELCYNKGTIISASSNQTSYTGGIVGSVNNNSANTNTYKNLYNVGRISGSSQTSSRAGGIFGYYGQPQNTSYMYSVGEVTGNGGAVSGTSVEEGINNAYYLSTLGLDGVYHPGAGTYAGDYTTSQTEAQLKAAAMVTTLNNGQNPTVWAQDILNINNGYPVFEWQNDDALILEIWNKEDAIKFRNLVNGGFDYSGYTVQLMADVDLAGSSSDQWTPIGSDTKPFAGTFEGNNHTISGLYINASTGNWASNYQGLFGKTSNTSIIQNVTVSGNVTGYYYTGGLVGYNQGTISNCYGSITVLGYGHSGAIVGHNDNGIIQNVRASGTVSGNNHIGGVVGYSIGTISNSSSSVTVSGTKYAGGIVGVCEGGTLTNLINTGNVSTTVEDSLASAGGIAGFISSHNSTTNLTKCYNAGSVTGHESAGGILGWLDSGTVNNVYNVGAVCADVYSDGGSAPYAGGLIGYISSSSLGTLTNGYNAGTLTNNTFESNKGGVAGRNEGTITNTYYLSSVATKGIYTGTNAGNVSGVAEPKEASALQAAAMVTTLNNGQSPEVWGQDVYGVNNGYPIFLWQTANDFDSAITATTADGKLTATANVTDAGGNTIQKYEFYVNGELKKTVTTNALTATAANLDGLVFGEANTIGVKVIATNGKVSYASTSLTGLYIFTKADMESFRNKVNAGTTYVGKTIYLMADVDLEGESTNQWIPIGYSSRKFGGTFEGNNHAISGLYISLATSESSIPSTYVNFGLFGVTSNTATIQNLTVQGSISTNSAYVQNAYAVGGIVGENSGTIRNCTNRCSMNHNSDDYVYTGGIAGDNNGSIIYCVNYATVGGTNHVGGIAGRSTGAISNSNNEGSVSGKYGCIGGIVGYLWEHNINDKSNIDNCYNVGKVSVSYTGGTGINTSEGVGGIVGCVKEGTCIVSRCYNEGEISVSGSNDGGVMSYAGGVVGNFRGGELSQCYNSGDINSNATNTGGIIGTAVNEQNLTIKNIYNVGAVKGGRGSTADPYPGGLIGFLWANGNYTIEVMNGYNTGTIKNVNTNIKVSGVIGECSGTYSRKINATNLYYLNTVATSGVGRNSTGYGTFSTTSKTSAELQAAAMVTTLDNGQSPTVWAQDTGNVNNGYPIFAWQQTFPSTISVAEQDGKLIATATATPGSLTISRYEFFVNDVRKAVVETSNTTASAEISGLVFDSDNTVSVTVHTTAGNTSTASTTMAGSLYIFTKADMEAFRDKVNAGTTYAGKTIEVMADIDMQNDVFTAIGTGTKLFSGTFDGHDHVISRININTTVANAGLFTKTTTSTIIKNVGVSGTITSTKNYVGGIVGYNLGTIEHCFSNCTISGGTAGAYLGGIAGYTEGNITKSWNLGTISGKNYVGGIVGQAKGSALITLCYNSGNVSAVYSASGIVGGIAGNVLGNAGLNHVYNIGKVQAACSSSANANLGGIVGYVSQATASVSHAYNIGEVENTASAAIKGGIAGRNTGNVSNTYYLSSTATSGIHYGTNAGNAIGITEAKSSDELKGDMILELLNGDENPKVWAKYPGLNQGYPVFGWQNPYDFELSVSAILVEQPGKATVTASPIDTGRTIIKYNFYVGNVLVDEVTSSESPITRTVNGIAFGKNLVSVVAVAADGTSGFGSQYVDSLLIGTASDLKNFASSVNEGKDYAGKTVKVVADIDLENEAFTPIGNSTYEFAGTFAGNKHTISGINISVSSNQVGLFSKLPSTAHVSELYVEGSVSGQNYVGGIVGYSLATIEDCSSDCTITGTNYVGGIAGYTTANITSASNTGDVSGAEFVGGIAGQVEGSSEITECFNTGNITASSRVVGGIVGELKGTASVNNAYNTGAIQGNNNSTYNSQIGGLVGHVGVATATLQNGYNTGSVTNLGNADYYGGVVGRNVGTVSNTYYLSTVAAKGISDNINEGNVTGVAEPKSSTELQAGAMITILNNGQSPEVWGMDTKNINNGYPIFLWQKVDDFDSTITATTQNGTINATATVTDAKGYTIQKYEFLVNGELKDTVTTSALTATATGLTGLTFGDNSVTVKVTAAGNKESNAGTTVTSLYIYNKTDMESFRDSVNAGTTYEGQTVELMADVDLQGSESSQWTPAGSDTNPFAGTFEGNNHAISGLYINNSSADYQGLFGKTSSTATIQNVSVEGSIIGKNYVGGIVGYNSSTATIQNVSVEGSIIGKNYVGGIVGYNLGNIYNCHNNLSNTTSSNTISASYTGGIAGYHSSGTIRNCDNSSTVSAATLVLGGIVGHVESGIIEKSYNTGEIHSLSQDGESQSGGIVGRISGGELYQCYNSGHINSDVSNAGGIIGTVVTSRNNTINITIKNIYNVGRVTANNANYLPGGLVGYIRCDYNGANLEIRNGYNTGTIENDATGNALLPGAIRRHVLL